MMYLPMLALLLMGLLASCSSDNNNPAGEDSKVVNFSSSIEGNRSMSRAVNNTWTTGDALGIFMKTGTGLGTIVDGAENKKYTTSNALGQFAPASTVDAVYYPANGNPVDFVAYYPYSSSLVNNKLAVNVSNQANQESIDVLYSDNAKGKTSDEPNVTLNFRHQLSKLVFDVTTTEATIDLTKFVVSIKDINTTAKFDLADGSLSDVADKGTIVLKTVGTAQAVVSEGIVLPSQSDDDIKLEISFEVAGIAKTQMLNISNKNYEKGKKYIYTLTVATGNDGDVKVLLEPNAIIEDWTTGASETIDVIVPIADGSKQNPFSIAEAAVKVGTTEKWITGYIVGSTNLTKSIGEPTATNIVLADKAEETDFSKCIVVDLEGSAVAQSLNIVDYPELVGAKVTLQGDIVNDVFENSLSIVNVNSQEGGMVAKIELFSESFGEFGDAEPVKISVNAYEGYDSKSPIMYSTEKNPYTTIDFEATRFPENQYFVTIVRNGGTDNTNGVEKNFKISNIDLGGAKELTLTFDYAFASDGVDLDAIIIKCNGEPIQVEAERIIAKDRFQTSAEITIPEGTTEIEFIRKLKTSADVFTAGDFRLDNISIRGVK